MSQIQLDYGEYKTLNEDLNDVLKRHNIDGTIEFFLVAKTGSEAERKLSKDIVEFVRKKQDEKSEQPIDILYCGSCNGSRCCYA